MLRGEQIHLKELQIAYKKLKANVYYDKTQLILRNKIVTYEQSEHKKDLNEHFETIIRALNDETEWKAYSNNILKKIDIDFFPKQLVANEDFCNKQKNDTEHQPDYVIFNHYNKFARINKLQSFIDIPVDGQILGILWILSIGQVLDNEIYDHSYGNRLSKRKKANLSAKDNLVTFSPHLFAPYYEQYGAWRDRALKVAEDILQEEKDVIILTLDLKRFFYHVNFTQQEIETCYNKYLQAAGLWEDRVIQRLNDFVYLVLKTYSEKHLSNIVTDARIFLPIGFYPSNILANYYLATFDEAVLSLWNPRYYGRYVDDIIIVESIEKNWKHYDNAQRNLLTQDDVIQYFCCECPADRIDREGEARTQNDGLLISSNDKSSYFINPRWLGSSKKNRNDNKKIQIQKKKVKIFYLKKHGSHALLERFRQLVLENSSEFRYLPQDHEVLFENDYSEIYDLEHGDSINKLNEVKNIRINKYKLSKFLGKLLRIEQHTMPSTKWENEFYDNLLKIFDFQTVIDNYLTWGRVLQLLIIRNRFDDIKLYIERIYNAIDNITIDNSFEDRDLYGDAQSDLYEHAKETLYKYIYSAICREFALVWGPNAKKLLEWYEKTYGTKHTGNLYEQRKKYCFSRMCDKYSIASVIDFTLKSSIFKDKSSCNLYHFEEYVKIAQFSFRLLTNYSYHPYIISQQELSFAYLWKIIKCKNSSCDDFKIKHGIISFSPKSMNEKIQKLFRKINFLSLDNASYHRNEKDFVNRYVRCFSFFSKKI